MTIANLSITQLKTLVHLVQQRESLQAKLAKVNAALAQLERAPAALSVRRKRPRKITRRNGTTLKDAILAVLSQAGPKGLSVKEIASMSNAKVGSVSVWIYTGGQEVKGLKKIAPGRFTYKNPA